MGVKSSKNLESSCRQRDLSALKCYTGKTINQSFFFGMTPLFFAIKYGDWEVVNFMIHHGADVTLTDDEGFSPLHYAYDVDPSLIPLLLSHGALKFFPEIDKRKLLTSLILRGRDISALMDYMETLNYGGLSHPLITAADFGTEDIVRILVLHGCDVNFVLQSTRISPVQIAVHEDRPRVAKILLEYGAKYEMSSCVSPTANMRKIVFSHYVKLRSLNLYVSPKDLELLSQKRDLDLFAQNCDNEVAAMKKERISENCYFTFYHILTRSVGQVTAFLRNQRNLRKLAEKHSTVMFPIYSSMLDLRIELCSLKANRRNEGFEIIRYNLSGVKYIPDECVEQILNFFSEDELRKLIMSRRTCEDCMNIKKKRNIIF